MPLGSYILGRGADTPFTFTREFSGLGLTIWLIWELIEHWDELWAAAEAAALAATQMMASSLDWLAKKLGIPRHVLRDRIYKIKQRVGLRGDENVRIDPETGDVYGPNGQNIGNVLQPR